MKKIIIIIASIITFLIVCNYIADSITHPFTTQMNQITNNLKFNIN